MIETETLNRWIEELVAFANGKAVRSLFDESDFDLADYEAHRLPEEERTQAQRSRLRRRARAALTAVADWKPSSTGGVPKGLIELAADWLDDDRVRSTHPAHAYTPIDGVLSLSEDGRLQVAPRFRSDDAKFAATFAELIQRDAPAMIKRCTTCRDFFVYWKGSRGQPRKLCDTHYEQSKETRKKTK